MKYIDFFYRGSTHVNLVLLAKHLLHSTLQVVDVAYGGFLDSPDQKRQITTENLSRIL